jgi:hypothetical protein
MSNLGVIKASHWLVLCLLLIVLLYKNGDRQAEDVHKLETKHCFHLICLSEAESRSHALVIW